MQCLEMLLDEDGCDDGLDGMELDETAELVPGGTSPDHKKDVEQTPTLTTR